MLLLSLGVHVVGVYGGLMGSTMNVGEAMKAWYRSRSRPTLVFATWEEFDAYCDAKIAEYPRSPTSLTRLPFVGTGSVGSRDDLPPDVGVRVAEVDAPSSVVMVDPTRL